MNSDSDEFYSLGSDDDDSFIGISSLAGTLQRQFVDVTRHCNVVHLNKYSCSLSQYADKFRFQKHSRYFCIGVVA